MRSGILSKALRLTLLQTRLAPAPTRCPRLATRAAPLDPGVARGGRDLTERAIQLGLHLAPGVMN
jgi:hypothetical protein